MLTPPWVVWRALYPSAGVLIRPSRYLLGIESRLSLPAEPASASRARRFVRGRLADWGADRFEEPAALLTSELVTNAVLHARSAVDVTIRLAEGQLWVGVADEDAGPPVRKRYRPQAATGRGLLLVERIASSWGTEPSGAGKVVWFCLDTDSADNHLAALAADFDAELADLGDIPASGGHGARAQGRPSGPRPVVRRRHPSRHREPVFG